MLKIKNLQSYTATLCNPDDHEATHNSSNRNSSLCQGAPTSYCTLNVTNCSYVHNGNWAPIVHIKSRGGFHLAGFCRWIQNPWGGNSNLIAHAHPSEGMHAIILSIPYPGLVYENYCKYNRSLQYDG